MWNRLLFILLILFSVFGIRPEGYSQNGLIPGIKTHYGFIIPHSRSIRSVTHSNPWGIEAEWNWLLTNRNAWNYCYCFPRTGISFLYINFANPEVLGCAYSPYVYIEPVLGAHRKINFSLRFGFGPAFMNRVYDEHTNPDNLCYSSRVSFIVLLDPAVHYRITDRMNVKLSGNYNHISNGGIKNPNKGINFPTVSAGIDYNLRELTYTDYAKTEMIDLHPDKWRFDIVGFGTGKSDVKGEQRFAVYGFIGGASRVIGRVSALSMAIEGTVDNADKTEIERDEIRKNGELADHKYVAALLGHELLIGRFIFSTHLGAYLYSPFKRKDPLYQRYGLTFNLTDWLFIGTNIKAHRHVADFLDIRVGFSF